MLSSSLLLVSLWASRLWVLLASGRAFLAGLRWRLAFENVSHQWTLIDLTSMAMGFRIAEQPLPATSMNSKLGRPQADPMSDID